MAYERNDFVTASKMEEAIAAKGLLVITTLDSETNTYTCDKTWQEIYDAFATGTAPIVLIQDSGEEIPGFSAMIGAYCGSGVYYVDAGPGTFETDSPNGYPSYTIT